MRANAAKAAAGDLVGKISTRQVLSPVLVHRKKPWLVLGDRSHIVKVPGFLRGGIPHLIHPVVLQVFDGCNP